jgi:hypothetical protein
MANIKLTDTLGAFIQIAPEPGSAIMKYFKAVPDLLIGGKSINEISALTLTDPGITALQLGLSFRQPVPIGTNDLKLTVKPEVSTAIAVFVPDPNLDYAHGETDSLFGSDKFEDPLPVAKNDRYVSVGFTAGIIPELSGKTGDLTFGFSDSSTISVTNYQKFTTIPDSPTFLKAVETTIGKLQLPGDVEDLLAMDPDSAVSIDGNGSLRFSGSADLLSVVNPLASVNLAGPLPALQVSEGASIAVGASFQVLTQYEVRVCKTGTNEVHLGYYTRHGSEIAINATASAGIGVKLGDSDLFAAVISAISPSAQADIAELTKALSIDQTEAIHATVKAGIERSLEVGLQYEFSSLAARQAAFLYSIDLTALDASGRQAIHMALSGDLAVLASQGDPLPAGITCLKNIFLSLQKRNHVFKINLLGIYNYISISKLGASIEFAYEPQTGQLTITDTATASRIAAGMVNLGRNPKAKTADLHKLRSVLAENFLITAAYMAESHVVSQPPALRSSHTYFELHDHTNHEAMRDELDTAVGLGLMTRAQQDSCIQGIDEFGRTLSYAESTYDNMLANALFLNGDTPRSIDEYEQAGRGALQMIIHDGDQDDYRLRPAREDPLWTKMKSAGQFNFKPLFPLLREQQVAVIAYDYTLIMWWATAMRGTSEKLAAMQELLKNTPHMDVENNDFKELHVDLAEHLKSVAANTKTDFGRPWGLIAMSLVLGNQENARMSIIGPVLSIAEQRPHPAGAISAAAG